MQNRMNRITVADAAGSGACECPDNPFVMATVDATLRTAEHDKFDRYPEEGTMMRASILFSILFVVGCRAAQLETKDVSSVEVEFKEFSLMGEIHPSDYDTYLQYKRGEGGARIVKEKSEGNWVYFAVKREYVGGFPEKYLVFRESYKARLPKAQK